MPEPCKKEECETCKGTGCKWCEQHGWMYVDDGKELTDKELHELWENLYSEE